MEQWLETIQTGIRLFFILVIPIVVIFFRIKNKIKTGFAIGLIVTSFMLGIIVSSSVRVDPYDTFERHINSGNREEARKALKVIIQYGPEHVEKIDEGDIIYRDLYRELKADITREYVGIARRYNSRYAVTAADSCDELEEAEKNLAGLKHAVRLLEYSESIGGSHEDLKNELQGKIDAGEPVFRRLSETCE